MRLPRTLLRSSVFYLAAKSLMKLGSFGEDIPCHTWLGPHASCKYALLRIAPLNGPRLSSARKTSQQTGPCDATPEFVTNNYPQVRELDTANRESSCRHKRRSENEIILPVMDCVKQFKKADEAWGLLLCGTWQKQELGGASRCVRRATGATKCLT